MRGGGDLKRRSRRFGEEHLLRTALFWAITQRVVEIPCRRFVTTYRSHLQGSRILGSSWVLAFEVGADRLSWNVGMELPLPVAQQPRRAQFSSTSRQKPEFTQDNLFSPLESNFESSSPSCSQSLIRPGKYTLKYAACSEIEIESWVFSAIWIVINGNKGEPGQVSRHSDWARRPKFRFLTGAKYLSLLSSGKFTTHLHQGPRLRMGGAVPPTLPSWHTQRQHYGHKACRLNKKRRVWV